MFKTLKPLIYTELLNMVLGIEDDQAFITMSITEGGFLGMGSFRYHGEDKRFLMTKPVSGEVKGTIKEYSNVKEDSEVIPWWVLSRKPWLACHNSAGSPGLHTTFAFTTTSLISISIRGGIHECSLYSLVKGVVTLIMTLVIVHIKLHNRVNPNINRITIRLATKMEVTVVMAVV